ncbi:hypothetical protein STVA_45090 [Allostella vacuolata]|nr:hypothetical protein STVA_45090 [Stella vacuolata]
MPATANAPLDFARGEGLAFVHILLCQHGQPSFRAKSRNANDNETLEAAVRRDKKRAGSSSP